MFKNFGSMRTLKPKKEIQGIQKFSSKNCVDNFLTGTSSVYIEQMYQQWKKDNTSVHISWAFYFTNVESGISTENSFQSPPSLGGCKNTYK
jgi:hypothetical protein